MRALIQRITTVITIEFTSWIELWMTGWKEGGEEVKSLSLQDDSFEWLCRRSLRSPLMRSHSQLLSPSKLGIATLSSMLHAGLISTGNLLGFKAAEPYVMVVHVCMHSLMRVAAGVRQILSFVCVCVADFLNKTLIMWNALTNQKVLLAFCRIISIVLERKAKKGDTPSMGTTWQIFVEIDDREYHVLSYLRLKSILPYSSSQSSFWHQPYNCKYE